MGTGAGAKTNRGWEMRLPKFRCKNKIGNWCFFTVLHNGNVNEENFNLETLSQFTGLFDKQSVEIYEGDIQKQTLGNHYWIYVVKSLGGQFGNQLFSMTIKHNMSVDEEAERYTFQEILLDCEVRNYVKSGKYVEIIGNIYENSELLK